MPTTSAAASGGNRRAALVASAVIVGLVGSGGLVWRSTSAAFTANTSSGTNSWTTGELALSNDGSAGAVFDVEGMVPGATGARCIAVTYSGNLTASVKLYATSLVDDDGLGDHVDLAITSGSGAGADCSSFVAAGGAIYTGTLADLAADHGDFATGLGTFTPSAAATKVYRIAYTLNSGTPNSMQDKTASVTFKWEAQSLS